MKHNWITIGGDILSSEKDEVSNSISFSTGDVASGSANPGGTESWQHVGFASRPSDVTEDKSDAAQCLVVRQSSRDIAFATRDVRSQQIYANLKAGETCLFGAGSDGKAQGRILIKQNGSIALYTKVGNTSSGKGMAIILNPGDDSISIVNSKGFGIIIDEDGVKITSKGASLSLAEDGTAKLIATGKCVIDGTAIALGANALPVTPALKGLTGIAGIPSLKVTLE